MALDIRDRRYIMLSRKILVSFGMFGIGQSVYHYTQLPDKVAIHFGKAGHPDSWASNEANLTINISLYILLVALFIVIPLILKIFPTRFISLPNKEYWLAEVRRNTTIDWVSKFLNLFGTILIIFFLILGHLNFRANMSNPVVLNENAVWSIVGCFLILTIVWLIVFYRNLKMLNQANSADVIR